MTFLKVSEGDCPFYIGHKVESKEVSEELKEDLNAAVIKNKRILERQFKVLFKNQIVGYSNQWFEETTEGRIEHTTYALGLDINLYWDFVKDIKKLRIMFLKELKNYVKNSKFIIRRFPSITCVYEKDVVIDCRLGICPLWNKNSKILGENNGN